MTPSYCLRVRETIKFRLLLQGSDFVEHGVPHETLGFLAANIHVSLLVAVIMDEELNVFLGLISSLCFLFVLIYDKSF